MISEKRLREMGELFESDAYGNSWPNDACEVNIAAIELLAEVRRLQRALAKAKGTK